MSELAEDRKLNILNVQIYKRTFEGKLDDSKNHNAITSKYKTSYKYAVSYDVENYEHNPIIHCVVSKKDAEKFIEELKTIHNVRMEDSERVIVIKNEDGGDIQIILKIKNYTDDIENIFKEVRERYVFNDGVGEFDFLDEAVRVILDEHKVEYKVVAYEAYESII